jgi:[ribosomal protein S5]-alanine N-acetyltransferase
VPRRIELGMPLPLIETPRLIIRDVLVSDVDDLFGYMQQERYWRDVPIEPPTVQSITALVNGSLQDQAKQPRTDYFLAAVEKRSQSVIGEAILHVRSLRWRQGEIGWGISPTHTQQGLATEIGFAMLELAFGTLGLHRVYAQCREENHASRQIMTKLGMREEGILRENVLARGAWWSSIQCSLLAHEWAVRDS